MLGDFIRKQKNESHVLNWDTVPSKIREMFWIKDMKFSDVGFISAGGTIFVRLDVICDIYEEVEKDKMLDEQFKKILNDCGYTLY